MAELYARRAIMSAALNFGNVQDIDAIGLQADGEPPLELFNEDFANREFATVIPRSVFINGRAAAPARITLPEQRLQNAPVLMASPQIAPASPQSVARAANKPAAKPPDRVIIRVAHGKGEQSRCVPRRHSREGARSQSSFAARICMPRLMPALPRGRQAIVLRAGSFSRRPRTEGLRADTEATAMIDYRSDNTGPRRAANPRSAGSGQS